jgi:single-strand DNA-binding protein
MTAETTLIGNTVADVELRFTQSGKPVASVTIAVADRKLDKSTNQWVDGDTWFARCTIWGEMAEHAASSILKGTRVIASGRLGQRDWEDKEGNRRTSVEVTLDEIGPSLRYDTADVLRAERRDQYGNKQFPDAAGGVNTDQRFGADQSFEPDSNVPF